MAGHKNAGFVGRFARGGAIGGSELPKKL